MFWKKLHHFHQDELAATAVEYAIMLAVIIIACIGAVLNTGEVQQELWNTTADGVTSINNGPQL